MIATQYLNDTNYIKFVKDDIRKTYFRYIHID